MRTRLTFPGVLVLALTVAALPAAAQSRGGSRTSPGGAMRGGSHVAARTGSMAVPRGGQARPTGSYAGPHSPSRGQYVSPSARRPGNYGAVYNGARPVPGGAGRSYGPPPAWGSRPGYPGAQGGSRPGYGAGRPPYATRPPAGGPYNGGHYAVPRPPYYGGYRGPSHGGYYGGYYGRPYHGGYRPYYGVYGRPYYGGYYYGPPYGGYYARPYYTFRPWFSIGFGISVGYPVAFPVGFTVGAGYGVPYGYGYGTAVGVVPGAVSYGGISFEIDPPYANIVVDGQYVGDAGNFSATARPLTLATGRHRVEIRADGFEPVVFDIDVLPGQVIPYRGAMVPY